MNDTRNSRKEKKQHIQVFIRVRPTNDTERIGKSVTVVDTPSNKEIVVRERPYDKFPKRFTFDRVFGPNSKQLEIYNVVVSPLVEEVLAGYNCTVFAYGQTGTGKTFTMEGMDNNSVSHWQEDTPAGIIPRALSHLFDELRTLGKLEYSIKVSFLELYNEEIFDLLSSRDEAAKIRIYEDPTKKGSVIVHGLEEIAIHRKDEVFNILQRGSEKRQTATTLMNVNSSRSHTIFSITIHIKESSIEGEELIKIGKLNLVDLAGSENIGRSGAVDKRAREAGNINQSLLTLSRVITALVEKTLHVPYRDSKLTRLLQESLGGRTKTSIIATISPASINLEETLSTLDYAHRAKNITNRPEINQRFSKKALLQEYITEIERLKRDLIATREQNGIYLSTDSYNELQSLIEFQNKEVEGKLEYIKVIEETLNAKQELFDKLERKRSEQAQELQGTTSQVESTVNELTATATRLATVEQEKEEQKHLIEKHAHTENVLLSQVQTVLNVADTATEDVQKLHDKIYRKIQVGQQNNVLGQQFKKYMKERVETVEADVAAYADGLKKFCTSVKETLDAQQPLFAETIDRLTRVISETIFSSEGNVIDELQKNINDSDLRHQQWLDGEIENVTIMANKEHDTFNNMFDIVQNLERIMDNEIVANLQLLDTYILQESDSLTEFTKEVITSIAERSNEECDRLNSTIQEIRDSVEEIRQSQNNVTKRRENFAKTIENLQRCFNELQCEEEENNCTIVDTLNNIDEMCNVVNNQVSNYNRIGIENDNKLQEELRNDLEIVKQEVSTFVEESRTLTEDIIAQSKMFIDQFKADLNKNCDTLTNFENCVKSNMRELQQKMKDDKSNILSAINDVYTTIYNASQENEQCLRVCKIAFTNACTEIVEKLESEVTNIADLQSRIITELRTIVDQVDKFFVDDLFRDVPTGSTPARKSFQYPRKLIKTSPTIRMLNSNDNNNSDRETLKEIDDNTELESILGLNNNTAINETMNAT